MLRTVAINSNQIVLSFGVLIAFWSPKQFKNEGELYIVYGKAFGSSNSWRTKLWSLIVLCLSRSKECKEGTTKRGKTEWRKQRTAAAVFFCTFGALPKVHFLHAIYHFKAQEVKNSTLQTVYDLELKWGSYSLWKMTAPSWRKDSAKCCEITLLLRNDFAAFLHSALDFPWSFTPRWKPNTTRWKPTSQRCGISLLLRSNFAALCGCLRNLAYLIFTCEMVLSLRNGP